MDNLKPIYSLKIGENQNKGWNILGDSPEIKAFILDSPRKIEKLWGYEEEIENTEDYCIKHLIYTKPSCSSVHRHLKKKETFKIIQGACQLELYVNIFEDFIEEINSIDDIQQKENFLKSSTVTLNSMKDTSKGAKVILSMDSLEYSKYITIYPGTFHRIICSTPLVYIHEVSTKHNDDDVERIIPSYLL